MKKIIKELPKWKVDLYDSIIDAVDRMKDAIEEADNDKILIESAITDFESELKEEINTVTLDAEELMKDKDFCIDAIFAIPVKDYSGTGALSHLQLIEETNGYHIIECKSLAEVMQFEAFKEKLEANPYQLKLIA